MIELTTNTSKHAHLEIEHLKQVNPEHISIEFEQEILAICEAFGKSGQSGGGAPYAAMGIGHIVSTLCLQKPISPITGEDWEWIEVNIPNVEYTLWQNKRDGRIIKNKEGLAWFTEAIVFQGDKTGTFTAHGSVKTKSGDNIPSTLYIKAFPFLPKTFVVEVQETEWADKEETEQKEGGGWWSSIVKDDSQLNPAFEYYKRNILE